jgi:glycosyltransferase involved in cell wall biosynthesis
LVPGQKQPARIGILDHTGPILGGAQLVAARMAAILSQHWEVELIHGGKPHDLASLVGAFCLDLGKVKERTIPELSDSFSFPGLRSLMQQGGDSSRMLTRGYDLFIYSGHGIPPPCFAKRGLIYCHFPFEMSPLTALEADGDRAPRNRAIRSIHREAYRWAWRRRMRGYRQVLANSQFTAEWILRRWGRSAEVLYPPVDLSLTAADKENLILSVGRFTGDLRSKAQLEQVRAFRNFLPRVKEPWTLRIIGTCRESVKDQDYLTAVQDEARGLPVEFLMNPDRESILRSLARAKLFWHTTGLSVDELKRPELAEHFGIATVEAMRAGCVPIVIESGGQREIIENGVNGFLVKDLSELIQKTAALACDGRLLTLLSGRASQRSMVFSGDCFDQRISSVVSDCLER